MVSPEKHKAFTQGFYFFASLQKNKSSIRGNKFCANKQVKETKVRKFLVFEHRLFPLFVRTFCCFKKKLFLKFFCPTWTYRKCQKENCLGVGRFFILAKLEELLFKTSHRHILSSIPSIPYQTYHSKHTKHIIPSVPCIPYMLTFCLPVKI